MNRVMDERYEDEVLALQCPECGGIVWDLPHASKLAKCWNAEGHASGAPLAFDTMPDEEEDDVSEIRQYLEQDLRRPGRRLATAWAPREVRPEAGRGARSSGRAVTRVEVTYDACDVLHRSRLHSYEGYVQVEDVHPITLTTGSGSLEDYWPAIELFATGMLGVEEVAR